MATEPQRHGEKKSFSSVPVVLVAFISAFLIELIAGRIHRRKTFAGYRINPGRVVYI